MLRPVLFVLCKTAHTYRTDYESYATIANKIISHGESSQIAIYEQQLATGALHLSPPHSFRSIHL